MARANCETSPDYFMRFRKNLADGLENTVNYFKVSPQLTILDMMYSPLVAYLDYQLIQGTSLFNLSNEAGLIVPITGMAFMLLTANRFKAFDNLMKYKNVREALSINSWDSKIINTYQENFCSRNAANTAAIDEGYNWQLEQYYFMKGRGRLNPFKSSVTVRMKSFKSFYQACKDRIPSRSVEAQH